MRSDRVHCEYLRWLTMQVSGYRDNSRYQQLFEYLFDKEFTYILEMDGNRAENGIDLRYQFAYENKIDKKLIDVEFRGEECSVLEMMVALAVTCEEHIMEDVDKGNRTGVWFWTMITNLGLDQSSDSNFSFYYVDEVVERFLNREYEPDGTGGLFTIKNCQYDLREIDIWYQLCWYLNTII